MKHPIFIATVLIVFSYTAFGQFTNDHLNKGITELNAKHYQPAIDDLNLAIVTLKEDKPQLCQAYYEKAKSEYALNDYTECVYACNHIMSIDSNFKEAYWQIAKAFRDNDQPDDALKNYASAILHYSMNSADNKSDLALLYYERGNVEWRQKKYAQTIKDDSMSLLLNPNYGGAYWDRGFSYENTGKHQRAINDYVTALSFYKDDKKTTVTLYNNMGYANTGLKNFKAAIDDFNRALALNVDYEEAYWGRGDAYRMSRQSQLSLNDYNKALTYYKDDNETSAELYNLKAYDEEDMKNYDKAIDDDSIARVLNPKYTYAYWELARCYDTQKNYASAYYNANKSVGLLKAKGDSADLAKALCLRGRIQVHSLHYSLGIKDYNYAITLDTKSGWPYFNRAHAYLDTGLYQPAAADYARALTLRIDDSSYFTSLYGNFGFCEDRLKNYQQALEYETKSIALDSTISYTWFERGRTYLALNNKPSAFADFKHFIKLDSIISTAAFCKLYMGDTVAAVKMMEHKLALTTRTPAEQSDFEYVYARFMALTNKPTEALAHLKKAIDSGYPKGVAANDPDLDTIKNKPEFADMVK